MVDKIQGIFSVEKTAKIGTVSTEKKVKQQMYCQAIEKEDGQIEVSRIDAILEEKNKHFFNACAMQLRKQELYTEAIDYYNKSIELCAEDDFFSISQGPILETMI